MPISKDISYREGLTLDVYYPDGGAAPHPAVVFVTGFSDRGAEKLLGRKFKEMDSYIAWANRVAGCGAVGVLYANEDPVADARAVIEHVRSQAAALQIDGARIGIWSCSGNVPNALALMMTTPVNCAALFYPYTLDLDGSTHVAHASAQFRFMNAAAGKTIHDLPREVPTFIARAGGDQMPGLNAALDRFIAHGLAANLPLTVVNHANAPHAFDLSGDDWLTREIVRESLAFLRFYLRR